MCLFSEIRLLSSCSLTCCLLLIIILFLYLSLQKHAHLLLLHGNHLLVSLSCSAASVIHNIPPSTPPLSATLGWMQQSKRAVCLLFSHYPSIHSPPRLIWLRNNLPPQNVTGIPQLRQEEECCLLLLMASKCCCKGIFGTVQQYPLSQLQTYMFLHIYNIIIF